jgi:hypothetical protein
MGANTMVAIFRRRATSIAACLFLLAVGYAGNAAAQVPPMKEIVIYNNTHKDTIYPVLAAFTGRVDLWMQAQFKNDVTNVATQLFCNNDPSNTPCNAQSGVPPLYRAYINPNKGIPWRICIDHGSILYAVDGDNSCNDRNFIWSVY